MQVFMINICEICRFDNIIVLDADLNKTVQVSLFILYPTTHPFLFTSKIFSLLIGLVGANIITLLVCANHIMWERSYSRYVVAITVCSVLNYGDFFHNNANDWIF